jgi:hypothetical protein
MTTAVNEAERPTMTAVRVRLSWFDTLKPWTLDQRQDLAWRLGGIPPPTAKRLLDVRRPAYRTVNAVRSKIVSYLNCTTLPYPLSGIRLIRQDRVDDFSARMRGFQEQLERAVEYFDRDYDELKADARRCLGDLYDPADYPDSLVGLFAVEFDFPKLEPLDYLLDVNPELYRRCVQEFKRCQRQANRALDDQTGNQGTHDKSKTLEEETAKNLAAFLQWFRRLDFCADEQLKQLVASAQQAVGNVEPKNLQDDADLRRDLVREIGRVLSELPTRPRHTIFRHPR